MHTEIFKIGIFETSHSNHLMRSANVIGVGVSADSPLANSQPPWYNTFCIEY